MQKETLIGFWNHPEELRNLWNIPESMVLFIYLQAYDINVVSRLFWSFLKEYSTYKSTFSEGQL